MKELQLAIKKFPILYHKGKGGNIYSWEVEAEGEVITSTAGTLNGLKTVTSKKVEQKNIGKANETSLEDQAIKEAQAMWTYKVERKYSETIDGAQEELFLPMLAQEFEKKKKKLRYSLHVQRKLDGCRALAHWEGDEVVLTSRGGLIWEHVPHINRQLEELLPKGQILDGELYIHGKTFQEITRLIKKPRPETPEVEYHIYDSPSAKTWLGRHEDLIAVGFEAQNKKDNKIILVSSHIAGSEEEVKTLHDQFVEDGYEGAIIRPFDGTYLFGYRSDSLLKLKNFEDEEYQIVGYKSGVGRYENAICFRCVTKEGLEFNVNPKRTVKEKEAMLEVGDTYIGSYLKVRYVGKTEDSKPKIAVGLGIRPFQDMPLPEK
jgi:DNA ligase-1